MIRLQTHPSLPTTALTVTVAEVPVRGRIARAVALACLGLAAGLPQYASAAEAAVQSAQVANAPRALTLRDAVTLAVTSNPTRVKAANEITAAGFEHETALWARFPTVSIDASSTGSRTAGSASTTVRADQPLWTGGRITGQIESTKALLTAAQLAESDTRRKLAEDTSVAYINWMYAQERIEIARGGVDQLAALLQYARRREAEGLASAADVAIGVARHGSVLAQIEDLKGAVDNARAQLEALVVSRVSQGTRVSVPPVSASAVEEAEKAYLDLSQLILQRRSEVESARAQADVRKSQMYPKVLLRAEYLTYQNSALSNDSRASVVVQFTPDAGLASYSSYQAAATRIDSALAQLAADENATRLRARTNSSDYSAARRQVEELTPQVQALESAASSFMRQFEAGRKTWLDVLNTHKETLEARLSLSRATNSRDVAALRLMVNNGSFARWLGVPEK